MFKANEKVFLLFPVGDVPGDVIKYRIVEVLKQKKCYRIKEVRRDVNPYSIMPETRTFEEVERAFKSAKMERLLYE